MSALIEFDHVVKRFAKSGRTVPVLDDIVLDIQPGELVTVAGPSGCGKSTLLNMTAGLLRPSSGQIRYKGEAVTNVNTSVGYVTQRDSLLPWRSARGNIEIALELRSVPRSRRTRLVQEVVQKVGLAGFEDHYPAELSGGMRKRVALARTLIYSPETLLMDEPFGALDAQLKLILQNELMRLWDADRKTIVFVTHDLSEAVTIADRVVVLSSRPGRVKLVQRIDLPRPRDAFQVRFTDRFGQLHQTVWNAMQEDIQKGKDV